VHPERRRGKSRTRILYWFRTPPGVKVGRSALDEAAIREIEEHNPEIDFDWTRILKGQGAPDSPPVPERRKRPRDDSSSYAQRDTAPPAAEPRETAAPEPVEDADTLAQTESVEAGVEIGRASDSENVGASLAGGDSSRAEDALLGPMDEPVRPLTPAHASLGSEGVARLRGRHAEILARISERVPDPVRREELKSTADRLNPDTWVTEGEVREGLERYEAVLDSLRAVVGQKRRRRRRGRSAPAGSSDRPAAPEDLGDPE
jgi:hypothetical protein